MEENLNKSVEVNEGGNNEQVKKECISRLSDFFRVTPQALSKFEFDGKDNIKALTKALNSTSDEGTRQYYEVCIKSVKKDLGINESRTQIKRVYSQYAKINVNEKAPIRNKVIGFVGKKFVTEEEMKNFLSKMNEELGRTFDSKKWFGKNQRYFESFENRGQKVLTLSKYGKRVLEMIAKTTQKQTVNESVGLFKNIRLNENLAWEDVYEAITVEDYMEYSEGDDTWIEAAQNILKLLKLEGKAAYWICSEDEDPKQDRIEKYWSRTKNENVTVQIMGDDEGPDGKGSAFYYDLKTPMVCYEGPGITCWIMPINIYKKM